MIKKDLLGKWLSDSFSFSVAMKKLSGVYEGYSALQVFLPGTRAFHTDDGGGRQALTGEGYKWLTYQPMNECWALLSFFDPSGELIRWYFDISRENFLDENGIPCRYDSYLDLIILPGGETITKDADELKEALDKGDITIEDYDHAYKIHDSILAGKWSCPAFLADLSGGLLAEYIE